MVNYCNQELCFWLNQNFEYPLRLILLRRKVQAQIDEVRKLKLVIEGDPKSTDKFADIFERQRSSRGFRGRNPM